MITRNQRAATAVFKNVERVSRGEPELAKKYRTLCKKFGSLVRTSGLVGAVAFLQARSEAHHDLLLNHLREELQETGPIPAGDLGANSESFHSFIQEAPLPIYMVATRVTLQLLHWHRRIAETLIEGEAEDDET